MRSIPTEAASAITWPTASESGAASVTISICACTSTQGTGSGSGNGAGLRSKSRLCRSAMKVNYSAASRRGKSTGVLVTVEPAGN